MLTSKLEDITFAVLDVETTGLSPVECSIIEIGIHKVKNFRIIDSYSQLINPGCSIPFYITSLTGITNRDVEDAPLFEDIKDKILDFIDGCVIVGHNLQFDMGFIKAELGRCEIENFKPLQLCTLRLAKRIYPELKSKSLGNVAYHLSLKNPEAHRASGDAKVTAQILIKMMQKLKFEGISELNELLNYQFNPNSKFSRKVENPGIMQSIQSLPKAPGIYYFLNSKKEIIYIGKAKSLKDRLKSYFASTAPAKTKRILKQAKELKMEQTNSELTALLLEAELIKTVDPKLNVQLKKYNSKYFLRIRKDIPFPKPEITNHLDFDGNDYFGVFLNKRAAARLLELIEKAFLLRECNDKELAKNRMCILAEIDRCLAPCVNSNFTEYNNEISKIYEFIFGKNQFVLNRLLEKMKRYSDELKFEKSAEIKELIQLVLGQIHKSALISEPLNKAEVLIEISEPYLNKDFILLLEGKIYIKQSGIKKSDDFDIALDDYFLNTIQYDKLPTEEDLEKLKITVNWIIKNRTKVRIFYLKDFASKTDLFTSINNLNDYAEIDPYYTLNLKELFDNNSDSIEPVSQNPPDDEN